MWFLCVIFFFFFAVGKSSFRVFLLRKEKNLDAIGVVAMAGDDVDFYSELFGGDDDDDNMCYIDINTVMEVLDEDSGPLVEVGFSLFEFSHFEPRFRSAVTCE